MPILTPRVEYAATASVLAPIIYSNPGAHTQPYSTDVIHGVTICYHVPNVPEKLRQYIVAGKNTDQKETEAKDTECRQK